MYFLSLRSNVGQPISINVAKVSYYKKVDAGEDTRNNQRLYKYYIFIDGKELDINAASYIMLDSYFMERNKKLQAINSI